MMIILIGRFTQVTVASMSNMVGKVEKVVDHRFVMLRKGSQSEGWLTVYADGRIKHHVENDGYQYLRRGPEAVDRWIDSAEVARLEGLGIAQKVEAAIREMNSQ